MADCRECSKWETCPCGNVGHENGTSYGYSIGECSEFEREKMDKDPCEICREQAILELFARIGGRTLGQKDCEYCNVRRERKDG